MEPEASSYRTTMSAGDADAVMRVESYIEEVLKPDFVIINKRRCAVEETIAAFDKLEEEAARYMHIAAENDGEGRTVSTMVDVGYEVYTQAEIDVEVRPPRGLHSRSRTLSSHMSIFSWLQLLP